MHTFTVDLHTLGFTSSLLTFLIHSTFLWTPAEAFPAEPQVYGSFQPIIVAPGDDVILPCHLEPPLNVEGLTVEWSKPDLKPDPSDRLSRVGYVHLYRNRQEVVDMKLQSYVRRTSLFKDELKHGNISLKITNVTLTDAGRYRCFIPKLNSRVRESIVELVVDANYVKTETPPPPTELQTPHPSEETHSTGQHNRSRLIPLLFLCVIVILGGGAWLLHKLQLPMKRCLKQFAAEPNDI